MRRIDVNYRGSDGSGEIVWTVPTADLDGQKELLQPEPVSSSKVVLTIAPELPAVLHMGGSPELVKILGDATDLAFPGANTSESGNLTEALRARLSAYGGALIVLFEPDHALLADARAAQDTGGLPAWGIVTAGSSVPADSIESSVISTAEQDLTTWARVLRSTWERHVLERTNARLRGDLLTFGTRITHDLRTPLGGVLTTTEMLREVLAEDAPANVPLTQPILDSTEGLVKLIERASFFARTSASSEPSRAIDMSGPFWNAFQHLEGRMVKAQTAFAYPSTWPMVQAHEQWIEGVWRALLTNALQHGAPGKKIEAGWESQPNRYRFWLRNEGAVPVEKQPRLFFPFHRLHESGAPRGLGLPIVQRLVELDGGDCGFEVPSPGIVEFYFRLRAVRDQPPVAPPASV